MAYSPHSIPRLLRWSFITASRRDSAPCPKNDKAGMILLKMLLFVSIKPGKSGWLSAKYRSSVRYTGRYCRSELNPTPGQVAPCPQLHCFLPGAIWWLANVQQTAIFIVTPRATNRTAIFRPYMRLEQAHFYSEKCPLRRSSPLCSKCRWRWGKRRRPVCRDQTPQSHPAEMS